MCNQFLGPGKSADIADSLDEIDIESLTVKIAVKVEHMHFDLLRRFSERRIRTDVDGGSMQGPLYRNGTRVDSIGRNQRADVGQICRGKTDRSASLSPVLTRPVIR